MTPPITPPDMNPDLYSKGIRKVLVEGMKSTYILLPAEVKETVTVDIGGLEVVLDLHEGYGGGMWVATHRQADISGYGRTQEEALTSFGVVLTEALKYRLEQDK